MEVLALVRMGQLAYVPSVKRLREDLIGVSNIDGLRDQATARRYRRVEPESVEQAVVATTAHRDGRDPAVWGVVHQVWRREVDQPVTPGGLRHRRRETCDERCRKDRKSCGESAHGYPRRGR